MDWSKGAARWSPEKSSRPFDRRRLREQEASEVLAEGGGVAEPRAGTNTYTCAHRGQVRFQARKVMSGKKGKNKIKSALWRTCAWAERVDLTGEGVSEREEANDENPVGIGPGDGAPALGRSFFAASAASVVPLVASVVLHVIASSNAVHS